MPALNLLDLYICLWDCYVLKSVQKIQLEEEQQQLRESNEWLEVESDLLIQRCNEQALVLWERKCALQGLHEGVVSVLKASNRRTYRIDRP